MIEKDKLLDKKGIKDNKSARYYNEEGFKYANLKSNNHIDIRNNHENAINSYNCAIKLDEHFVLAYNNRSESYYALGMLAKAIEDLDTAIRIEPDYYISYNNKANIFYLTGKYGDAIDTAKKTIIKMKTFNEDIFSTGTFTDGETQTESSKELVSCFYTLHLILGRCYSKLDSHEEAVRVLEKVLNLEQDIQEYRFLSQEYLYIGDEENFRKYCEKALELYKNDLEKATVYNSIGLVMHNTENLLSAIKSYKKAIDFDSNVSAYYWNLAFSYLTLADLLRNTRSS